VRRARTRDNERVTSAAPLELPGWRHTYSGKVRDLYVPFDTAEGASPAHLLVVASDRVSAFDHVLEPGIPDKGVLLTTLSLWWFDRLAGGDGGRGIPNHLAADHALSGEDTVELIPAAVRGRAMGVATVANWGANLIVSQIFLMLIAGLISLVWAVKAGFGGKAAPMLIWAALIAVLSSRSRSASCGVTTWAARSAAASSSADRTKASSSIWS